MGFPWEQIITSIVSIIVAVLSSQGLWSWLQSKSENSNKAIMEQIAALEKKFDNKSADDSRERILKFNTEILRHEKHTKEDFTDILVSIDNYERYCHHHEDYPNNRAVLAIENIKKVYSRCMETDDFL